MRNTVTVCSAEWDFVQPVRTVSLTKHRGSVSVPVSTNRQVKLATDISVGMDFGMTNASDAGLACCRQI